MLHHFRVRFPILKLKCFPPFIDDFPLFLYKLFFRVAGDQYEEVHESIEGEEQPLVEFHLSHALQPLQIHIQSLFLLRVHEGTRLPAFWLGGHIFIFF